ncbi:MAG: lipase family alpha/beta hydrolase [Phycisphaerales bacterium JB060]
MVAAALTLSACSAPKADLAAIYNTPAQQIGEDRTPVLVIPGILGSRLENRNTGQKIWGSFTYGAADADTPSGAREIALPMAIGMPLGELRDDGFSPGVLDRLVADITPFRRIRIGAYVDILTTLAAGEYRDEELGSSGAIDYGGLHYTCFQYGYDWRRDISENAAELHQRVLDAQQQARDGKGLPPDEHVKVDVVAHSMGGLVLRYYLRYGPTPLPEDGSIPELTWAGAQHVRKAILIGTPNAGSAKALEQLVEGLNLNPIFPNYRPAVLGTMPAIYQLLPRPRHHTVIDAATGEPIDVLDIETWQRFKWGLASPQADKVLRWLLPDVESEDDRHAIAMDHLAKCLARADQLFRALDVPANPPPGTEVSIFIGDAKPTDNVLAVQPGGDIRIDDRSAGDGTVTRKNALMDERQGRGYSAGLISPVRWSRVQFINADHLGLTRSTDFVNNLLYMLLEEPVDPLRTTAAERPRHGHGQ